MIPSSVSFGTPDTSTVIPSRYERVRHRGRGPAVVHDSGESDRYRTERYQGAVGLNWYSTDPTLRLTMAYCLQPDELAFAEPHLTRVGELMGGPVAR